MAIGNEVVAIMSRCFVVVQLGGDATSVYAADITAVFEAAFDRSPQWAEPA